MAKRKTITASTHTHSSVRRLDQTLEDFLEINPDTPGWKAEQAFVLIWKQDERKSGGLPRMTVEGEVDIAGEVEIARYFARCSQGAVPYDSDLDPKKSAQIDARLEAVASLVSEDDWERKLEEMMGRGKGGNAWLQKAELSLPSLLLWSWCKASRTNPRLPNLKKWLKEINNHPLVRAAA